MCLFIYMLKLSKYPVGLIASALTVHMTALTYRAVYASVKVMSIRFVYTTLHSGHVVLRVYSVCRPLLVVPLSFCCLIYFLCSVSSVIFERDGNILLC